MSPPMSWFESRRARRRAAPRRSARRRRRRSCPSRRAPRRASRPGPTGPSASRGRPRSASGPSASTSITPNWSASAIGWRIAATVTPRARLDVRVDHLAEVHAVHVVGADHDDDVGLLVVDQVQALQDRVGRPAEPALAEPLLRGHRGDVGVRAGRTSARSARCAGRGCATCTGSARRSAAGPELIRFDEREVDRAGSCPPNGTAGLARSAVRGISRLPSPPARTMPKTFVRCHGRPQ